MLRLRAPAYSPGRRKPETAAPHRQQGPRALPALHTPVRPCRCRCRARCTCWGFGKWSLAPPQEHGPKCGYGPSRRRPLHHLGRFLGGFIALRDGYVRFLVSTSAIVLEFPSSALCPLLIPPHPTHTRTKGQPKASTSPSLLLSQALIFNKHHQTPHTKTNT